MAKIMGMATMLVIRKRPPNRFPGHLRRTLADILEWNKATVTDTLVGDGWAWLPGQRDPAKAGALAKNLRDAGMQAGLVTREEASDVGQLRQYNRISLTETEGFVLDGPDGSLTLGCEHAGGISLLGLRWDGEEVRPFTLNVDKPGLLVWGTKGPLGVVWLREKAGDSGLSALEIASFLRRAATNRTVRLVDVSYRRDDIPDVRGGLAPIWERVGGAPDDMRMLAHGVMLRALERGGVLDTAGDKELLDVNGPLSVYEIRTHPRVIPDLVRMSAWGSATLFFALLTFTSKGFWLMEAGVAAGLFALAHGFRLSSRWFRLYGRPVSRIRSMAMGPVHLEGHLEAAMLQVSPHRGVRCVHYETQHQQRSSTWTSRTSSRGAWGGWGLGSGVGVADLMSLRGWRTVSRTKSPVLPFYLKDSTGRVLIDSLGGEWFGMEKYVHRISAHDRVIEWVLADGAHAVVYGIAQADPDAPALEQLKDGLNNMFLAQGADQFDLNRDGVLSDAERTIALRAFSEQLKGDGTNVSIQSDVYVHSTREDPLVVSTRKGLSMGWRTGGSAVLWFAFGLFVFLATFVYPEETQMVTRMLLRIAF